MPTACILQPGAHVRLTGERLLVTTPPSEDGPGLSREIHLRDVERLVHTEHVQLTGPALAALLRADVPVSVLAGNGSFLGSFLPALNTHAQARLRQYQRTLDTGFTRDLSARIVAAKLYNQRRVLQRLHASRQAAAGPDPAPSAPPPDPGEVVPASRGEVDLLPGPTPGPDLPATLAWLDCAFASVRLSRTVDEVRGYEGATTARYFAAWATFLPPAFPFERRSTRPPLNPVNACISFAATILYSEMVAFLHAHGLDPALGCLHVPTDGRWSLALDLLEPFRPALVEALALDLFSHQILNADHFERRDDGVFLNDPGRRKFFLQYERRMERQFLSEAVGHRTTLRQQLEQQALLYKAALEDSARFDPFVMN